jgi:hypothetical protein
MDRTGRWKGTRSFGFLAQALRPLFSHLGFAMHIGSDPNDEQAPRRLAPLRVIWRRGVFRVAPWERDELEGKIRDALGADLADRVFEWAAPPRLVVVR